MSDSGINRRDFLKVLGLGGTSLALAGCGNTSIESGAELVESFVQPEDYVVPGVGVYFASTCTQCASNCGIMGRVREGRVLKLEGNPESKINNGKLCGLGQAAVQAHYNPDRLATPMLRQGDKLQAVSWDKAMAALAEKVGPASGIMGEQFAFLTGEISGHQKVLLQNYLEALGSKNHVVYEAISPQVGLAVNKKVYGVEQPRIHLDKAKLILSFGSDFLGTGASPVHFAQNYAKFRKAPRGTLVQIEPKMTLTGANADRWIAIIPGTEGILALGIARELLQHEEFAKNVSSDIVNAVKDYDKEVVSHATGVRPELITHVAALLWERTPSVVLSGASAEGHGHGTQNAVAIQLLNKILANNGRTIEASAPSPLPQLAPISGSFAALKAMNDAMALGKYKVVFVSGANPVFTTPNFMNFRENFRKVPFKVAFSTQMDETCDECDLVLPLLSQLEDFGTQVSLYQPEGVTVSMQQPLMNRLHADTRGFGDILLDLLKARNAAGYKDFADYYSYLRSSLTKAKSVFGSSADDETFWGDALSHGFLQATVAAQNTGANIDAAALKLPAPPVQDPKFPFYLVPSERHSMRDGRHANLPWLQENPDPLTTVVWDSWAEIHPKTAASMDVKEGDILEISSRTGSLKVKAYIFPGIHPDAISLPFGQGHESLGRYARGVGVNPFRIFDQVFDADSGELAMYATRVLVKKDETHEPLIKDEGPVTTQQGRKLVVTLAADKAELSKEI